MLAPNCWKRSSCGCCFSFIKKRIQLIQVSSEMRYFFKKEDSDKNRVQLSIRQNCVRERLLKDCWTFLSPDHLGMSIKRVVAGASLAKTRSWPSLGRGGLHGNMEVGFCLMQGIFESKNMGWVKWSNCFVSVAASASCFSLVEEERNEKGGRKD